MRLLRQARDMTYIFRGDCRGFPGFARLRTSSTTAGKIAFSAPVHDRVTACEPGLKSVPLLQDVASNDEDRKVANVVSLPTALGCAHWVAPGVPSERVEALRQAYAATMKDAEFVAEAQKLNMELRPQSGAQVSTLAKRVTDTPKPVLERTAKILGW